MQGEIVFDAGGQRYTLFLGNAAQCAIEAQYEGKGFFAVVLDGLPTVPAHIALNPEAFPDEVLEATRKLNMTVLRDLAWHGLQKHHPGTTPEQVSDITDHLGASKFGEIIGRAVFAARDQGGMVEGAGQTATPGKPRTRARQPTGTPAKKSGRKQA